MRLCDRSKRVILTIPFEDTHAAAPLRAIGALARDISEALISALNYMGAELVTSVLVSGMHRRGAVRERSDTTPAAHHAGREAVEK